MLDLKFVRENPDIVKQNIKNKFQDKKIPLVDEVIELDAKNRAAKKEADDLRANKNKIAKQIGALMGQGKKEEAEELKKKYTIIIVTHNMQQAARVSDSTAFFYMGEMVEFGDTKKIFTNPDKVETQNYITGRFG